MFQLLIHSSVLYFNIDIDANLKRSAILTQAWEFLTYDGW